MTISKRALARCSLALCGVWLACGDQTRAAQSTPALDAMDASTGVPTSLYRGAYPEGHDTRRTRDEEAVAALASLDRDRDGQYDLSELSAGTDPLRAAPDADVDDDGLPNVLDLDVDGDGLRNAYDPDIDGDGIRNRVDRDADGDGLSALEDMDDDGDFLPDPVDSDRDGDGDPEEEEDPPEPSDEVDVLVIHPEPEADPDEVDVLVIHAEPEAEPEAEPDLPVALEPPEDELAEQELPPAAALDAPIVGRAQNVDQWRVLEHASRLLGRRTGGASRPTSGPAEPEQAWVRRVRRRLSGPELAADLTYFEAIRRALPFQSSASLASTPSAAEARTVDSLVSCEESRDSDRDGVLDCHDRR